MTLTWNAIAGEYSDLFENKGLRETGVIKTQKYHVPGDKYGRQ